VVFEYDFPLMEIFTIKDEISMDIRRTLKRDDICFVTIFVKRACIGSPLELNQPRSDPFPILFEN